MHVMNLASTLHTNDTISLPSKTMPKVTKVDINDSTIHPILSLLLREHRQSPRGNLPLIVDIAPPVVFRISPNIGSPISERVYEALNELMDFWSYYVQDPVLAKWIWVMLAVSVYPCWGTNITGNYGVRYTINRGPHPPVLVLVCFTHNVIGKCSLY